MSTRRQEVEKLAKRIGFRLAGLVDDTAGADEDVQNEAIVSATADILRLVADFQAVV